MAKKLIRGSVIGAVLGISSGIVLSYVIFFVKYLNKSDDTYASEIEGSPYINVMSTDTAEDELLRFHVRANSNSDEDIALKYDVRDAVLDYIGGDIDEDSTREEVEQYLNDNLDGIKKTAQDVIVGDGYTYPVDVYITTDYFPMREYGEMVIPAGYYEALRVDIGAAEGENFWCILYPMMCYTIDSAAVASKEDERRLSDELTEEEYERLFIDLDTGDNEVEVRFKLLEWVREMLG